MGVSILKTVGISTHEKSVGRDSNDEGPHVLGEQHSCQDETHGVL